MTYVIYFAVLVVFWGTVWWSVLWALRAGRSGSRHRGGRSRVALPVCVVIALLWLYVVSYAPYRRLMMLVPQLQPALGALDDLYVPLHWAFDHTALRPPYLEWVDFCGVSRDRLVLESEQRRRGFWGTAPPWLYAAGWLALGAGCVFGPPYAAHRVWNSVERRPPAPIKSTEDAANP